MASGWTIARSGQPHYGGIVERIIGTAMQMIHDELPGTTFSNPDQRGDYDSENKAALTLRELERWLTLAVGTYHGSVHNGLLQPPAARWAEAVARSVYRLSSPALRLSWSISCPSFAAP
jgi:putative transposase